MIFEERQLEKNNFTVRAIILFAMVAIVFAMILVRVFSLQISSYTEYELAALNNKNYSVPVQALRGEIYDRNGNALVSNNPTFDLIAEPHLIEDPIIFLAKISEIIALSNIEQANFLKLYLQKASLNKELVIKKSLTQQEIARFKVRSFAFNNMFIGKRYRRVSKHPELFAHALGYTSRSDATNQSLSDIPKNHWRDAEFIYANGFIEGRTGLEETYNSFLQGVHGKRILEINAKGRLLQSLNFTPPLRGSDLHTSLDLDAQKTAAKMLGARKGGVVAMDLVTGGINVLFSSPTYSINKLANGLSVDEFKELLEDINKPFFNRAVQGRYPPASTIKPAIGMFGLAQGLIDWKYSIDDPGYFVLPDDGRVYRGWKKGGHGNVNLQKALLISSNTYFFTLAYRSDMSDLSDHLSKFGFGKKACLDCFDEDPIFLPSPDWKLTNLNASWFTGDTVNVGVGQGFALATPMQLANYASLLANKGRFFKPSLVPFSQDDQQLQIWEDQNFSAFDWNQMHTALTDVVESDLGTGRRLKSLKNFKVAAKTGTAELVSLDSKEAYEDVRGNIANRDHAIIVAFGPMPNPRYAVSVVIENGESGGVVAGPVAIEVLKSLINE